MKVGIISDIHGNHYALEEVLKESKKIGIEKLLVLGDIVGYYYHPEKVLQMLEQWDCEVIKGNHEVILEELRGGKIDSKTVKKKYGSGHAVALEKLDEEVLEWLISLPVQRSIILDDVSFQLNHGSPWSIDQYLYPDAKVDVLERCNSASHDFVLIGHSHYPFSYQCSNSLLINTGSVGQSREKGGSASWAVVNTSNNVFTIKSTTYRTKELIKEVEMFDDKLEYSKNILIR